MIQDRLYTPKDNELIYHYCSPHAFVEIIETRTIWHSAYYTLNDLSERSWAYSVFDSALNKIKDEVGSKFTDTVQSIVITALEPSLTMISSYSLDADVLGQWRAYADNGRGFAIGFNANQIKMPAKPLRVLYDEDAQVEELIGNLKHIHQYERSIGFKFDEAFQHHIFNIGLDLTAYKHPSFSAEKEIRRVHVSGLVPDGESTKILPQGAIDQHGARLSEPIGIRFRIREGLLIPYVALDYSSHGKLSPVKEVVLGPQNPNHQTSVQVFLNTVGTKDVTVRRSVVPYA